MYICTEWILKHHDEVVYYFMAKYFSYVNWQRSFTKCKQKLGLVTSYTNVTEDLICLVMFKNLTIICYMYRIINMLSFTTALSHYLTAESGVGNC